MEEGMYNTKGPKIRKGYQTVKLYIPHDTLMGYDTKPEELKNERPKLTRETLRKVYCKHSISYYNLNELKTQ